MPKSVKTSAVQAETPSNIPQNLFISVKTFDGEGRTVGERIVDMCHYNTRNWLSNHLWWATHHGHCTEIDLAKPAEIEDYLAKGVKALAEKFNATAPEPVAAAA